MRYKSPSQNLSIRSGFRCFYCGGPGETRDHVPPKLFLERPFPANLTTVPSCTKCNRDFGKEEEYVFFATAHAAFNPRLRNRLLPGGDLADALESRGGLRQGIEDALIEGDDGVVYLKTENERIERVVKKLVVGLYFRRYEGTLSLHEVHDVSTFNQRDYPAKCHPQALTERFQFKRWDAIQPGVFEFVFVNDLADLSRLRCLINIYDTICAEGTCPRPSTDRIGEFNRHAELFDLCGRIGSS